MESDAKLNDTIQHKLQELKTLLNVKHSSLLEQKQQTESYRANTIKSVADTASSCVVAERQTRLKAAAASNTFDFDNFN